MRTHFILLSAAIFLASTVAMVAQQPVQQLTMGAAIEAAIANNRDLRSQRLGIAYADAQIREAESSSFPTISAGLGYSRYLQKPVFYFPGQDGVVRPVVTGLYNTVTGSIGVNQMVYNSAASTGEKTSEVYSQISRQQLRTKTAELVMSVKKAYYTAMLAREVLTVNQSLLSNAEENYKTVSVFYKAGARPEFDMIRAEVGAANLQPVVVQASDNYQMALDNLRLLLGMDQTQQIELTDNLVRPASLERVEPTYEAARDILERNNSQLQSLRMNAEVNRWLIKLKEADYYPTVSVFGSFQLQAQSDNFSDLTFHPTTVVGLNVGYNLFNWARTKAQIQEATTLADQTQLQLDQTVSGLRIQLESVMRRIDYARKRIGVGEKTIAQAERGYTIATASYKAGSGTQLQINDADLAMAQSKLNQLTAVYDYNLALADLEQLLGERFQVTGDGNNVKYSEK